MLVTVNYTTFYKTYYINWKTAELNTAIEIADKLSIKRITAKALLKLKFKSSDKQSNALCQMEEYKLRTPDFHHLQMHVTTKVYCECHDP
jgi:hypothetical protein